jgi:hypothetical protein
LWEQTTRTNHTVCSGDRMKRTSGGMAYAAIGGATALSALLTGILAAHAEEPGDGVSELRVNQGLIDQRIEQLSQVGDGGAQAAPNAPVTGGSFPRSFVIPGTDTSIRIGGEVRLSIDHITSGGGNNINAVPTNTIGVAGLLETTPLNNGDTNHGQPRHLQADQRVGGLDRLYPSLDPRRALQSQLR